MHTVSAEDTTWEIASRRRSPLGVKGLGLLEIQGQTDSFLSLSHVFLTTLIAYSSSVKEACGTEQLMTTLDTEVNIRDTGEGAERS